MASFATQGSNSQIYHNSARHLVEYCDLKEVGDQSTPDAASFHTASTKPVPAVITGLPV